MQATVYGHFPSPQQICLFFTLTPIASMHLWSAAKDGLTNAVL